MRHKILLVLLLAVSNPVFSDVFGLKDGMSLSQIKKKIDLVKLNEIKTIPNSETYMATEMPHNDDYYKMYLLSVSEKCGLVGISAIGKDKYDDDLIKKFTQIGLDINKVYGKGVHEITSNADQDSQIEIENIEVTVTWGGKEKPKLPNNLGIVMMKLHQNNEKLGSVDTTWLFRNVDSCT